MAGIVNKTRFQYKGIMRQIFDWRDEYASEFQSFPTVIVMDKPSYDELQKEFAKDLYWRIDPDARTNQVMGMEIIVEKSWEVV